MASQKAILTGQDAVMALQRFETSILTDATSHAAAGLITATGGTDFAEVSYATRMAIQVVNGITSSVIWTPEGSINGTVWVPLTWKVAGTTAITTGARTTPAATSELIFLADIDFVRFVRVNVGTANANGSTFTAAAMSG